MSSSPRSLADGKVGRVKRWEARQQAKFDRQQAEWPAKQAEFQARNVWVDSPTGKHYRVRAVPMGRSFLVRGGIFSEIARTFRAPQKKKRWAVGVVRHTTWTDKVLWREYLAAGADEKVRVAEIAEAVRNGTLRVTTRLHPRRQL